MIETIIEIVITAAVVTGWLTAWFLGSALWVMLFGQIIDQICRRVKGWFIPALVIPTLLFGTITYIIAMATIIESISG